MKRAITVKDLVQMTRIAGSSYAKFSYAGSLSQDFAIFSPNRRRFAVVLKKGNIAEDTNDYSLLLFSVGRNSHVTGPVPLVQFSSSSNREAINQITWLDDNDTLLFLGEHRGETTQLYSINCSSKGLKRLTRHPTSLVAYSSTADGNNIAYAAEERIHRPADSPTVRGGLHVTHESLSDLLGSGVKPSTHQLYFLGGPEGDARRLRTYGEIIGDPVELSISPDGHYLVVKTNVIHIPPEWIHYRDASIQGLIHREHSDGEPTWLFRYELMNTRTGSGQVLVDSPIGRAGSQMMWTRNSGSVIVTDAYLPLSVRDSNELAIRQSHMFTAEIKVPSREIVRISDQDLSDQDLEVFRWEPGKWLLNFGQRNSDMSWGVEHHCYRRDHGRWKQVGCGSSAALPSRQKVVLEQGLNVPPRLTVLNEETGRQKTLLDLNPQFRNLAFGRVEKFTWRGNGVEEVEGGLYLPPDYTPEKKYPLVIQTHGFNRRQFWIDGPFATAFAAQALASKEFVVLQVPDTHKDMDTPEEAMAMVEVYDNAIDELDAKDLVDTNRIGIVGFSRTGLYVRHMLIHGRHRLAAAVIADGFDDGYWTYLAEVSSSSYFGSELESLIGAPPFGNGLELWMKRSSGFSLDQVRTPLQIQVTDGASLLRSWDWFAGLKRLHNPVDLLYFPDGTHILQTPSARLGSEQATVRWFCFWLKGNEE